MSLVFNWNRGTVSSEISALPLKMLESSGEVLFNICSEIVALAKAYCPVDTGALQMSIRMQIIEKADSKIAFSVTAGENIINPKTGREVDYAVFVEAKQPFMKPALDIVLGSAQERIKNAILEKCQP